jgi:hypothetical protein
MENVNKWELTTFKLPRPCRGSKEDAARFIRAGKELGLFVQVGRFGMCGTYNEPNWDFVREHTDYDELRKMGWIIPECLRL